MYLAKGDRRFMVIDRLDLQPWTDAEYKAYAETVTPETDWMVIEHLCTMTLTEADRGQLMGRAPMTKAKADLIDASRPEYERVLFDLRDEVEQGSFPPIATAGELQELLHKRKVRAPRLDWSILWTVGYRPLRPDARNAKQAAPYSAKYRHRYWRLADTWWDGEASIDIAALVKDAGFVVRLLKRFADLEPQEFTPYVIKTDRQAP
jgi:hypothetical protein